MLDAVAGLLWSPLLCVLYVLAGLLVALVTGGVAWRRTLEVFRRGWRARPAHAGAELGHREAFVSALAASVGVGNLAGVATALHLGGPGALFWMWISALLGMHLRLASTYFAIRDRPADSTDHARATPMVYLERFGGGARRRLPRILAALLLVTGLVNANLIQSNSVAHTLHADFGVAPIVVAVVLASTVGAVVIGGRRSIVAVSTRIAPWMLAIYIVVGLLVLLANADATARAVAAVFSHAFGARSAVGGAAGYGLLRALQYGISRGVFSHGSGIGMAPFFQGANSDHPARGAFMAAAVPVVDTLVVCTITGLVILCVGSWPALTGAHLTVMSFGATLGLAGKAVVVACLLVFAFTTVISWAHFSERCFVYLGGRDRLAFRLLFCAVAFAGPLLSLRLVWSLADILTGALLVVHALPLCALVIDRAPELWRDLERAR